MPTTSNTKTYLVTPHDQSAPYTVEATSYDFNETTGRHIFKDGDELVANLLNVSVRRQPTAV